MKIMIEEHILEAAVRKSHESRGHSLGRKGYVERGFQATMHYKVRLAIAVGVYNGAN